MQLFSMQGGKIDGANAAEIAVGIVVGVGVAMLIMIVTRLSWQAGFGEAYIIATKRRGKFENIVDEFPGE